MGLAGGMKCVKYLLFFFNGIFWICGLALVIVGIIVQVDVFSTIVMKNAVASAAPITIIVVGVVIFIVAFFGCCGAWKENYCMVTMFSIFISLIIIVEIAAAITAYVFRGRIKGLVNDGLTDMVHNYNSTQQYKTTVDTMQEKLKCCGVNGSTDWKFYRPGGTSVPDSCCVTLRKGCGTGTMTNATAVHQTGCEQAVEEVVKKNVLWIAVASLVIAFLQIMGIVLSCLLMRGIRSGYEVM